jgi:polar amino acid transport system substrate-binding protein
MIPSRMRVLGALAIAVLAVSACSSAAATPTGPAVTIVATAPADQLIKAGTLTVCSDTSYPPQEYLDENNQAIGSDIDLIKAIAARMGLTTDVKTTDFSTIIAALTGGTCDVIISAQTINDSRKAQVDMIPYFAAGQSFVVQKGNPKNIKTQDDLCGKTIAAQTGTVEADHVNGTGDYAPSDGLSAQCVAKGLQPITLKTYNKDTDAGQALTSGVVDAHFTDEPVAGYEVAQSGGALEMVPGLTLEHAPEGISVAKNHTGLRDAVKTVLISMINDGSYMQILTKWGVESGAIAASDVTI